MGRLIIQDPNKPAEEQVSSDPIEACRGLFEFYPQVRRLAEALIEQKKERATAYNRGYNDGFDAANCASNESPGSFTWSTGMQRKVASASHSTTFQTDLGETWQINGDGTTIRIGRV